MKPSHTQLSLYGLNSYHNTTGQRDMKVLEQREAKAECLERRILRLMMENKYASFTPPAVAHYLGVTRVDSVRPRITTLTKWGYLVKLDEQRKGLYGIENNCWKWSGKVPPDTGPLWPKLENVKP